MLRKGLASACIIAGLTTFSLIPQTASARNIVEAMTQCGVGALVGGYNPVVTFLSNLSSTSYFATTSSTLPQFCVEDPYLAAIFIHETFADIEADLASGKGEHLAALNSIMSCEYASRNLRTDYAAYTQTAAYTRASKEENAEQLYQIVDRHMASKACSA